MAPPTVEIGGKETKVVIPTLSSVPQLENTGNTKKYKYLAGVCIVSVLVIAAVVVGSIALHHHLNSEQKEYDTETLYKGYHIPEHAHVDYINQITYVNNSRYNEVVAANNLHDYKRQLLVFKDTENKICYIDKLKGTFEEGLSRLAEKRASVPTPVKHVIKSDTPVDERILKKFAGDASADHCDGIPTFWVIDVDPNSTAENPSKIKCKDGSNALCREKRAMEARVISCQEAVIIIY